MLKKKQIVKGLVVALAATVMFSAGVAASTQPVIKDITAKINYGIKITLNGKPYTMSDSQGNTYQPITYKGRTYLPISFVGEALGTAISWNGTTSTINIGEKESPISAMDALRLYRDAISKSYDEEKLIYNGTQYKYGIIVTETQGYGGDDFQLMPEFNNGQYQKILFDCIVINGQKSPTTLEVRDKNDNKIVYKSFKLNEGINKIEFDIAQYKGKGFEFEFVSEGAQFGTGKMFKVMEPQFK